MEQLCAGAALLFGLSLTDIRWAGIRLTRRTLKPLGASGYGVQDGHLSPVSQARIEIQHGTAIDREDHGAAKAVAARIPEISGQLRGVMLLNPKEKIGEDRIIRKLNYLRATSEELSQWSGACKSYIHALPVKIGYRTDSTLVGSQARCTVIYRGRRAAALVT